MPDLVNEEAHCGETTTETMVNSTDLVVMST